LLHLIERWPESVRFAELYEAARRALQAAPGIAAAPGARDDGGLEMLGVELLQLYAAGIAELRVWDPEPSATVSERPMASPLARLQAQRGTELTTLLHHILPLDAFERKLVPLLDGNRDVSTLAHALAPNGLRRQRRVAIVRVLAAALRPSPARWVMRCGASRKPAP
jgi:hypothetical protein